MQLLVSLFSLPKQFHHDARYTCIVYFQIRVFILSEREFFRCVCKPVICAVFLYPLEKLFWVEFATSRTWGHAVAQLVESLRYKSEGRGFDSRWYHWNFSLT
jgi:hypothetical protein